MIFHGFTWIKHFYMVWLIWQLKRLQHRAGLIHNKKNDRLKDIVKQSELHE